MFKRTPIALACAAAALVLFAAPVPYTAPTGDLNFDGSTNIADLQCMVRTVYAFVVFGDPGMDVCSSDEECLALLPNMICRQGFSPFLTCMPDCLAPEVSLGPSAQVSCENSEADDDECLGLTHKNNADLNCDGLLGNQDLNFLVAITTGKMGGADTADYDSDGRLNWCDDDSDGDGDPDETDCEPLNELVGHTIAELCNGLDDNCDGVADEALGFTTCGVAVCENTVANCVGGVVQQCDPFLGWSDEVCNGIDDDCDGQVDEPEDTGETTCGLGECLHTASDCIGGQLTPCNPLQGALPEQDDGLDNDCDGIIDEIFIQPGDIVLTEIMQNPSCVSDYTGEWVELHNPTAKARDINGWTLSDEEEDFHVIASPNPLVIEPGAYLVLARAGNPVENGGVAAAYEYTGFQLANSLDQVILKVDGNVVDMVAYDGGPGFPDPDGASMSLSLDALTTVLNDIGSSWCQAKDPFGNGCGDLASPGSANRLCDDDEDGFSIPGGDCNEEDPTVYPGAVEACNGVDDDCDGDVDEDFPTLGDICDGDDADQCTFGTLTCAEDGMAVECVNEDPEEVVDVCDGADNDCDGEIDQAYPDKGLACDGEDSDECTNGTWTCAADGLSLECVNEDPTGLVDICDGMDNDCDGSVDEDYPLKGEPCDGPDSDVCKYGTYTCTQDGLTVECVNEDPQSVVELCDDLDNDCDGNFDEDFPSKGQPCDGVDSDQCENGTWTCTGDGLAVECVNETVTGIEEVCDDQDNDCDGQIDEDWVCCLEVGDSCGGDVQCCTKLCSVHCCLQACPEDGWVCQGGVAEMRDYYCAADGSCKFTVTAVEECGQSGLSDVHKCVDQVLQEEFISRGCSLGGCFADSSFDVVTTCSGTCESWCNADDGACGPAPVGTNNASDCQLDGWYCNGVDREFRDYACDGTGSCTYSVDELQLGGSPCALNDKLGPCAAGQMQCVDAALTCVQVVFQVNEECDSVDNNCDGTVDDFDAPCSSVCEPGLKHCTQGQYGACSALEPRMCTNFSNCELESMCLESCPATPAEACNSQDDDCDGSVDETFTCTPGQQETEACGNCGTRTRTCTSGCQWGSWGSCGGQGVCAPGASSSEGCGNCGTQERTCNNSCQWNDWGACLGQGICAVDQSEDQGCGLCGTQTRVCSASCQWDSWGSCGSQGICAPGQLDTQGCGNCGTQLRTCNAQCQWDGWGTCTGQGVCAPGAGSSQGCGLCGSQSRSCTASCQWGTWGSCGSQGVCSPGAQQSQGCGNCGTQYRSCSGSCQWGGWGSCGSQGVCSPGQSQNQACGNCGTQSRSCGGSCSWNSWGSCTGQGVCSSGSKTSSGCPNSCMAKSCSSSCQWNSECTSCSGTCSSGYKCGLGCLSGYHPESYNFSSSCGSCCSNNRTYCKPNCGSSWYKCGLGCPSGYHAESYNFSSSCGSCCSNNRTYCKINAGSSFYKCGFGCPSGYVAQGYSFSSSCGSCCSNNRTYCKKQ